MPSINPAMMVMAASSKLKIRPPNMKGAFLKITLKSTSMPSSDHACDAHPFLNGRHGNSDNDCDG